MNPAKRLSLICLAFAVLSGCAAQRYRAVPISQSESASRLESRNLQDPELRDFLRNNLGHQPNSWPPNRWDRELLTLAAFYYNPAMEKARARVGAAEASVITAGARPNPTLGVTPGVPSPYLFGLDFAIPVQTAGKRGYQVLQARNLSDAARFNLAGTAWKVRSAVRLALLDYLVAVRTLDQGRSQQSVLTDRVQLLDKRLTVGEISRPEVDLARIDLANTRLAVLADESRISQTLAALAAAIGVPVSALNGMDFSWPDFESPPSPEALALQGIQREAVINRLDVRQALAEYAAAQADLQLEIARQYPDVQIGPGYTYEEKNNFLTIGLSITLPVFNRNQGPIAQAEARRREAAANFLATQSRVIAETESASASYSGAWKELTKTKSLVKLHFNRLQVAESSFKAGETGPLLLSGELLQNAVAAAAKLGALFRAQAALGKLEDALERPLEPGDIPPLGPYTPALEIHAKEKK